jgi:hypothetical protein
MHLATVYACNRGKERKDDVLSSPKGEILVGQVWATGFSYPYILLIIETGG